MNTQPTTTLITPVYRGDFERFVLLRESIERCGIRLPHLAIVHTEDIAPFREIPFRRQLTVVSTADVLPAWLERKRVAWGVAWWKPPRWRCRKPMPGWNVQMLTKLAAAHGCASDTVVFVDADMAFVRTVDESDFHSDGKPHLYTLHEGLDVEMVEWVGRSMRFLGVNPCGKTPCRYTYSPLPMSLAVLRDLARYIERRTGRQWLEAVATVDWITEYATYGVYAEHVDHLKRVVQTSPTLAGWCWWPQETTNIGKEIERLCEAPEVKIVGVQSNLRRSVTDYSDAIRRQWSRRQHA